MAKPVLYYNEIAPPSRAVALMIKALNLDVEYKSIDTNEGDHLKPEFIQLNPQHTIPTLDDNGVVVWDSHAIITYLADKYDKTESLYPKDLYTRAIINQRLHYESNVITPKWHAITVPVCRGDSYIGQDATDLYDLLETFVKDGYMVGDKLTVADFSIIATISGMVHVSPINLKKHIKLIQWIRRMSQLPYYEASNGKFVKIVQGVIRSRVELHRRQHDNIS